jgi:hypothetical protein
LVKIISLSKPITWHGSASRDSPSPRGPADWVEQPQVIQDYFEALIDHEGRGALLAQMGMDDAKRLKEALFDFFHAASGTD